MGFLCNLGVLSGSTPIPGVPGVFRVLTVRCMVMDQNLVCMGIPRRSEVVRGRFIIRAICIFVMF